MSGTRRPYALAARAEHSLPLMGIGNEVITAAGAIPFPHLITPHGDREHFRTAAENAGEIVSLPLMGIGNSSLSLRIRGACTSLPLMGIGNCLKLQKKGYSKKNSLPLMGIGNQARVPDYRCQRLLITPHGDRKPMADMRCACLSILITPHGDRKLRGAGIDTRNLALITPHGDRKPRAGARPLPRSAAHYPSWGSETGGYRRSLDHDRLLITPHGDRKPRSGPPPVMGLRTHYPSWGSETWSPRPARSPDPRPHYPSWGSETERAKEVAAQQRQDSLPLMGIGNHADRNPPNPPRRHLITPHGDRKRFPSSRILVMSPTHYPSWGSETHSLILSSRSTTLASLPLMGIGNSP